MICMRNIKCNTFILVLLILGNYIILGIYKMIEQYCIETDTFLSKTTIFPGSLGYRSLLSLA